MCALHVNVLRVGTLYNNIMDKINKIRQVCPALKVLTTGVIVIIEEQSTASFTLPAVPGQCGVVSEQCHVNP